MSAITIHTPNLKDLFLTAIYEEADKEDKKDVPMKYYKLHGMTRNGYLSGILGNPPEVHELPLADLILSGNNIYRVWIKLYEYSKTISKQTVDCLLPPFNDMNQLAFMFDEDDETTILGFIDGFLKEFYNDNCFTCGRITLLTVNLL